MGIHANLGLKHIPIKSDLFTCCFAVVVVVVFCALHLPVLFVSR